ncbi:MAG: hypothetical protein ABIL62_06845 [Planctomycetota bacterium]
MDGSSRKTITGFIGDVYRFPNMLAENKNPTAYGTDGEYRTQQPVLSLPKGRNSNIEYPASSTQHPESRIKNQESRIEHPASRIQL